MHRNLAAAIAVSVGAACAWSVRSQIAKSDHDKLVDFHQKEEREQASESFHAGWDACQERCTRYMSARDYELMTGKPHPYKS